MGKANGVGLGGRVTPFIAEALAPNDFIIRAIGTTRVEGVDWNGEGLQNFAFSDDSENKYGLPTREFGSFLEASEEAAISRLYGGIHYRPAIDNGVTQGRALGSFIMKELDF